VIFWYIYFYSSIFLRHQTMDKVQKHNSFNSDVRASSIFTVIWAVWRKRHRYRSPDWSEAARASSQRKHGGSDPAVSATTVGLRNSLFVLIMFSYPLRWKRPLSISASNSEVSSYAFHLPATQSGRTSCIAMCLSPMYGRDTVKR